MTEAKIITKPSNETIRKYMTLLNVGEFLKFGFNSKDELVRTCPSGNTIYQVDIQFKEIGSIESVFVPKEEK